MKLLNRTFPLHDVRDVEAHVAHIVHRWLNAHRASLPEHDLEDLMSVLMAHTWRLSERYDPSHGLAFSTWSTRILRLRIIDWYRSTYTDTRSGTVQPTLEPLDAALHLEAHHPGAAPAAGIPYAGVAAEPPASYEDVEFRACIPR